MPCHAMPCHPIHPIDRRGPLPYRLTDPHWPRIVRASVPRSQLDSQGHTNAHTVGHHRPASQVLRSPPSLSTGEDRSRATSGPGLDYPPSQLAVGAPAWGTQSPGPRRPRPLEARAGPPATGQVLRSPPMLPTGKGQGTLKSHPLPPRPSVSPSAAKAHVRSIQPTGEGSWTSRAGHRAPVMPVAAP